MILSKRLRVVLLGCGVEAEYQNCDAILRMWIGNVKDCFLKDATW